MKQNFQDASLVVIGRLILTAGQAGFFFIFAAFLNPEKFGELSYLIALGGTVEVITRFGLHSSLIVYNGKENEKLSNQIKIFAIITSTIGAIVLIPINIFSALICFSLSYFIMNQHNLLGLQKYRRYLIDSLIKGITILVIPVFLYFIFDLEGILLGMIIGNFVGGFSYFKSIKLKVEKFGALKENFRVILHNYAVGLGYGLSRWIDKLIIMPLFGFASVGIYQFNLQVLLGLETIPLALQSYLLSEESRGKSNKKITLFIIGFAIIFSIIVIISAPILIEELFPMYVSGILSLQIMIISLIPSSVVAVLLPKLQANESTKIGYAAVLKIGLLLVLIIFFGDLFGLVGFSLSVLISTLIYAIVIYLIYQKSISSGDSTL